MPSKPLTRKAHLRLLSLYQEFGCAIRLRTRFLINKAYRTLSTMEELLTRADSWEYWQELKHQREGDKNGQAHSD